MKTKQRNAATRRIALMTGCASLLFGLLGCPPSTVPTDETKSLGLQKIVDGLVAPVALEPLPGDGGMLIVSQPGQALLLQSDGSVRSTPVLDLRSAVTPLNPGFDERGLMDVVPHPDFANDRRVFAVYTIPPTEGTPDGYDCVVRLAEFPWPAESASIDPASARVLLDVPHPQANHIGGDLAFGPDGYLYVSLGDGGGGGDIGFGHTPEIGNAQDLSTLLGKILRIDINAVDDNRPYGIPADNPFVDTASARPEIYALGLRNPYRMSFDRENGRLFVGDVGQARIEEVDLVEKGGNYGWNRREGSTCFSAANPVVAPADCPDTGPNGIALQPPIVEYGHGDGISVIGGYVYRGDALPALDGTYVFGDLRFDSGRLFTATQNAEGGWSLSSVPLMPAGGAGGFLYAFGQDNAGELYVLTVDSFSTTQATGAVFRLVGGS